MRATITPRAEMVRAWERVTAPSPPPSSEPLPRALNLQNVMDLGNLIFFTFRGRAYGIPPLAWREGEKILDAWLDARGYGDTLTKKALPGYFSAIRSLQRLLWRNCRPVGKIRRFLHRIRLHPNPFRVATEGEIGELAAFILGRRMTRNVRGPIPPDPPAGT